MRILQAVRRHKQALIALIIVGAVALIFFASEGWASDRDSRVELKAQPTVYVEKRIPKITNTTTTTTTTTTVPPTRRKVQETPEVAPVSIEPLEGDWVAQCKVWAEMAGIDLPASAITLISRESKCNPNAQNPNSTAYGIGQFLNSTWAGVGCVKTSDPIEQLRCMDRYVVRHGGWDGALQHSYNKGWY